MLTRKGNNIVKKPFEVLWVYDEFPDFLCPSYTKKQLKV